MLYEKEVKGIVNKTLLPTYDIFDEYRHFEPAWEWNVLEFKGKRLAVTVCEDIWNFGDNPLYRSCPMDELIKQRPDIMINLSASPFDYIHAENRQSIVRQNVARYKLPMIYCNTTGAQTDIVFDGGSLVMNADESIVAELPYFEEALQAVTLSEENIFTEPVIRSKENIPLLQDLPHTF